MFEEPQDDERRLSPTASACDMALRSRSTLRPPDLTGPTTTTTTAKGLSPPLQQCRIRGEGVLKPKMGKPQGPIGIFKALLKGRPLFWTKFNQKNQSLLRFFVFSLKFMDLPLCLSESVHEIPVFSHNIPRVMR